MSTPTVSDFLPIPSFARPTIDVFGRGYVSGASSSSSSDTSATFAPSGSSSSSSARRALASRLSDGLSDDVVLKSKQVKTFKPYDKLNDAPMYASNWLKRAQETDDKLQKITYLDKSRMHFSNALYGAQHANLTSKVIEYSNAIKQVEELCRKAGITGDVKLGLKSQIEQLTAASVAMGEAVRKERLKLLPGYAESVVDVNVAVDIPSVYTSFNPSVDDLSEVNEIKMEEFHSRLLDSGKVQAVKPLTMPWNKAKGFKYTAPNVQCGADKAMYSYLYGAGLREELIPALEGVHCNGTLIGLCNRMVTKLISGSVAEKFLSFDTDFCRKVNKFFFFDKAKLTAAIDVDMGKVFGPEMRSLEMINGKACAGFPYAYEQGNGSLPLVTGLTRLPLDYDKGPKVLPSGVTGIELLRVEDAMPILTHALYGASKLVDSMKGKSINDALGVWKAVVEKNPCLNTYMLKRKTEVIERKDYKVKVRPYGAQPLPTRLFGKYAGFPFEHSLVNFLEDPKSVSAYRYCAFFGGAKRLMLHFLNAAVPSVKLKMTSISYGDDQLIMFVFPDGSIVMWGPDVSAMDMSTSGKMAMNSALFINTCYGDVNKDRRVLMAISGIMAFQHYLHIGDIYCVKKDDSLMSGTTLTTYNNIFTSAAMRVVMEEAIVGLNVNSNAEWATVQKCVEDRVKKTFGFVFKPSDVNTAYYSSRNELSTKGILVPFLGNVVVRMESNYISVPHDINKFSASLVLSGSFHKTNELRLSVILGVYFTGAWYSVTWHDVLHGAYKHYYAAGVKDEAVKPEVEDGLICMLAEMGVTYSWGLPSREYMEDFNVLSRSELMSKWGNKWTHEEPLNTKKVKQGPVVPAKAVIGSALEVASNSAPIGGGDTARSQLMLANKEIAKNLSDVAAAAMIGKITGTPVYPAIPYPSAAAVPVSLDVFSDQVVREIDAGNPTANNAAEARLKIKRYLARRAARNKARDELRARLKLLADHTAIQAFDKFSQLIEEQEDEDYEDNDQGDEADGQGTDDDEEAIHSEYLDRDKAKAADEEEFVNSDTYKQQFAFFGD